MKTTLLKTLGYFAIAMFIGGLLALIVLVAKGADTVTVQYDAMEWINIRTNKTGAWPSSSVLITNVVSGDNGSALFSIKYSPPTARWTITTIIRRDTLNVTWRGKDFPLVDEKQVSSVTNYETLVQTWVKTNAPPQPEVERLILDSGVIFIPPGTSGTISTLDMLFGKP